MNKPLIRFHFGRDVFDLNVNSVTDRVELDYQNCSDPVKLELHKQDLANEVQEIINKSFGINATIVVSPSTFPSPMFVYLEGFDIDYRLVEKIMTEVDNAIQFHRGMKIKPENVKILMTDCKIRKE